MRFDRCRLLSSSSPPARASECIGSAQGAAAARGPAVARARVRRGARARARRDPRRLRPRRRAVRAAFADSRPAWALQAEQLGTGHAVHAGDARRPRRRTGAGAVRRRAADQPRDAAAPRRRRGRRRRWRCSTARARRPDRLRPHRARRARRRSRAIVEQKDATDDERAIGEVNTGIMPAPPDRSRAGSAQLRQRQRAGRVLPDRHRRAWRSTAGVKVDGDRRSHDRPRCSASTTARSSPSSSAHAAAQRARATDGRGVTLADPARFDVRGDGHRRPRRGHRRRRACSKARSSSATACASAPYCVLRDVRARRRHAIVHPHCDARRRAHRGRGCIIGPFARLRPAPSSRDDVHVGNFVEIKKSAARRRQQGEPPHLPRRRDGRRATSTSAPAPSPATTTA